MLEGFNPWKLTTIGLVLVMATALVTGLVVANWYAPPSAEHVTAAPASGPALAPPPVDSHRTIPPPPPPGAPRPAPRHVAAAAPGVPTHAVVTACNQYAAQATTRDKTVEVVKDGAIGAVVGAALGAAGGAVAGGGKGAGKGAAIGGIVGAGGGTLYGLNENHKKDERYREAYASCLRSRGYAG